MASTWSKFLSSRDKWRWIKQKIPRIPAKALVLACSPPKRLKRRYLRFLEQKWASVSPAATILEKHGGHHPDRQASRLCLLAHFDPDGRIDPYVAHAIASYKALGFDVVVTSTSHHLDPSDVERAKADCRLILRRANIGLDFASWSAAMAAVPDFDQYEELLLVNDSVFGPFLDLGSAFARINAAPEAAACMTDSWETGHHHMQSYFLFFKKQLLAAEFFKVFWRDLRLHGDKDTIIERYEIGLSVVLATQGFAFFSCFPFQGQVLKAAEALQDRFQYRRFLRHDVPINPTVHMWDILLGQFRFPFLKTEVLKKNRLRSKQVSRWRDLVPREGQRLVPLIEDFLRRTVREAPGLRQAP